MQYLTWYWVLLRWDCLIQRDLECVNIFSTLFIRVLKILLREYRRSDGSILAIANCLDPFVEVDIAKCHPRVCLYCYFQCFHRISYTAMWENLRHFLFKQLTFVITPKLGQDHIFFAMCLQWLCIQKPVSNNVAWEIKLGGERRKRERKQALSNFA